MSLDVGLWQLQHHEHDARKVPNSTMSIKGVQEIDNNKMAIVLLGVMIVTPMRNDPGHFWSPHANVLGWVIPNGKEGRNEAVDRPNQRSTACRNR